MIRDIIGEWDVVLPGKEETPAGRIVFLLHDGRVVVKDADPESTSRPNRVDVDGDLIRFEFLSPGSSRGNTHHIYELRMQGADAFTGTRRRGMLARVPVSGTRVEVTPEAAADAAMLLAEAEAEVVAALEAARRAAERAAAARAAVPSAEPSVQPAVAPAVLAALPAPSAPPAFVPVAAAPVPAQAPDEGDQLRITHRLTRGEIVVFAAEIHPQVYVWGGSFAAADSRLREAGWQIVEVDTEETTAVDDQLIRHAAAVRESVTL